MTLLSSLKTLYFKIRTGFRGYPLKFGGKNFRVDESLRRWSYTEETILEELAQNLGEGDVYVDVGANFGMHVLFARDRVGPSGRVVAFEPIPANLKLLYKNLRLNGYSDSVLVEEAAVSDSGDAFLEFYFENPDLDVAASLNSHVPGRHSIKVRNIRLDDYQWPTEKKIKVLKIDVEGAEFSVLKSGINLLKVHKPILLIEIHTYTLKDFETSREELLEFLNDLGYEEKIISFPGNKGESHYNAIYSNK